MDDDNELWRLWQESFARFRPVFTEPGFRRFLEWVTGLVVDPEEHTVTQALTGLGLEDHWMALERFVKRGRWETEQVESATWRTIAETWPEPWRGYAVVAVDDTKVHRTSGRVWGVCTFHEPSARSPNRAETVRAHNWVVGGAAVADRARLGLRTDAEGALDGVSLPVVQQRAGSSRAGGDRSRAGLPETVVSGDLVGAADGPGGGGGLRGAVSAGGCVSGSQAAAGR